MAVKFFAKKSTTHVGAWNCWKCLDLPATKFWTPSAGQEAFNSVEPLHGSVKFLSKKMYSVLYVVTNLNELWNYCQKISTSVRMFWPIWMISMKLLPQISTSTFVDQFEWSVWNFLSKQNLLLYLLTNLNNQVDILVKQFTNFENLFFWKAQPCWKIALA